MIAWKPLKQRKTTMAKRNVLPFEQGGLDSLCGIYGIVNAERIINDTTADDSRKLFNSIVKYLDKKKELASIITEGMLLKHIRRILTEVIGDLIPYQKLPFAGVANPDLNTFWLAMKSFLDESPKRAILLGMSGVYDHWTVVKQISDNQIQLLDSYSLRRFNRTNCTTAEDRKIRHHHLLPAQTYFLGQS